MYRQRMRGQWRLNPPGAPAERTQVNAGAFMNTEKFDTMLDLTSLHKLQDFCIENPEWNWDFKNSAPPVIKKESMVMLAKCGYTPMDIARCKISALLPAKILLHVLHRRATSCHMDTANVRKFRSMMVESSKIALQYQMAHLTKNMSASFLDGCSHDYEKWSRKIEKSPAQLLSSFLYSEDAMYLLKLNRQMHCYVDEPTAARRAFRKMEKVDPIFYLPSLGATGIITPDITIFHWKNEDYLISPDLLLEILNKSAELHCFLTYAHMVSGTSMPGNHFTIGVKFLIHLARKMLKYESSSYSTDDIWRENKGWGYLKIMEGLGVAELIRRSDLEEGWENLTLTKNLWKSVREEGLDTHITFESSSLGALFSQMTSAQIADLIGIVKLLGHPSLEIETGLAQLYQRTHENIVVDPTRVERTIGILMRDLFMNFFAMHKKYPVIDPNYINNPNISAAFKTLYSSNRDPASDFGKTLWGRITPYDWSSIRLIKNAEFDPIDKQITLLKDKAIGLTRSKVFQLLNTERATDRNWFNKLETHRALLSYLLHPHFDKGFLQYLSNYQDQKVWSNTVLDYLVIKLTGKECELKPMGRFFGGSPVYERNRRIVQEHNTMKFMADYSPDQLMTPDELTMIKKLYSFRHLSRLYNDSVMLQVSFDFSKWNNTMRHESIDIPGARLLDAWFGTNLYGKTMLAYENALVYYNDINHTAHWKGQDGGIEGLNQCTWSYIFIGGIKQALEAQGLRYQLTVKGDDVRAAIVVKKDIIEQMGYDYMKDRILQEMQLLCAAMGWSLNPHECFVSTNVICTSKQYQVRNTWLPACAKKSMACESISNPVFPTLDDQVANSFSTAHSACSQATVVLPQYVMALMIASRMLIRDLWIHNLSVKAFAVLLMWPQVIGGPGSLPLQTFFVRGENDMLAISVSLFRSIIGLGDLDMIRMIESILKIPVDDPINYNMLVSDPYSIPLKIPTRPASVLKNLMRDSMKVWVKNPDLKRLLSVEAQSDKKKLVDLLLATDPLYPKLLTAIYESSPFALLEEILAKFMQSTTIFAFFARGKSGHYSTRQAQVALREVLQAAQNRITFWVQTLKMPQQQGSHLLGVSRTLWYNFEGVCPTRITHEIRANLWQRDIRGITYPSLVDQNMILEVSQPETLPVLWDFSEISTQIVINQHAFKYQTDDKTHHYAAIDHLDPWLGTCTATKIKFPNFDSSIRSPTITKILNLLALHRVGHYLGKDFLDIVSTVLSGMTAMDPHLLNVLVPEAGGGHIAHRVATNSFSLTTMPNYRPNLQQLVRVNNENMTVIQADTMNRTINFGARHFHLIAMALFPLQSNLHLASDYPAILLSIFHYDIDKLPEYHLCPYCCNAVPDLPIVVTKTEHPQLHKYAALPLVGVSKYESAVLEKNIMSAITGKVRRLAENYMLNPLNEEVQFAAARVIMQEFALDVGQVYRWAQASDFQRIPTGNTLSVMAVNAPGKLSDTSKISIKVIKSISATHLYVTLLCEVIREYLTWICNDDRMIKVDELLYMTKVKNPLSKLFDAIIFTGALRKLSIGCSRMRYIEHEMKFPPNASSDGHYASLYFLKIHQDLIMDILYRGHNPFDVKFFVSMPDDDTVMEKLEQEHDRMLSLVCRIFIFAQGRDSRSAAIMYINIIKTKLSRLLEEQPEGIDDATLSDKLSDYMLRRLRRPDMEDVDRTKICSGITKVFLMFWLASRFTRGDITDIEDLSTGQVSKPIRIVGFDMDDADVIMLPPDMMMASDSNAFIAYGVKMIGENHIELLWMVTSKLFPTLTTVYPAVQEHFFQLLQEINKWTGTFAIRQIGYMTKENAENILLQQGVSLYGNDQWAEVFPTLPSEDATDIPTLTELCYLPHSSDELCHQIRLIPSIDNHIAKLTIDRFIARLPYYPYTGLDKSIVRVNPCELYRIGRSSNKSAVRYFPILYESRCLYAIRFNKRQNLAICLGDGSGGLSKMLLNYSTNIDVIYVSHQIGEDPDRPPADSALYNEPAEFLTSKTSPDTLARLHWKGFFPGDFTMSGVQGMIQNQVQTLGLPVELVFNDAEPPLKHYVTQWLRVQAAGLKITVDCCSPSTVYMTKVKLVRDGRLFRALYYMRRASGHNHFLQSKLSNPYMLEIVIYLAEISVDAFKSNKFLRYVDGEYELETRMEDLQAIFVVFRDEIERRDEAVLEGIINLPDGQTLLKMIRAFSPDHESFQTLWDKLDIYFIWQPTCIHTLMHTFETAIRVSNQEYLDHLKIRYGGKRIRGIKGSGKMASVTTIAHTWNKDVARMVTVLTLNRLVPLLVDGWKSLFNNTILLIPDIMDDIAEHLTINPQMGTFEYIGQYHRIQQGKWTSRPVIDYILNVITTLTRLYGTLTQLFAHLFHANNNRELIASQFHPKLQFVEACDMPYLHRHLSGMYLPGGDQHYPEIMMTAVTDLFFVHGTFEEGYVHELRRRFLNGMVGYEIVDSEGNPCDDISQPGIRKYSDWENVLEQDQLAMELVLQQKLIDVNIDEIE